MPDVDPATYRALRHAPGSPFVEVIDQRGLPAEVRAVALRNVEEVARAIAEMWVRGAPLIGAVGAYGLAMALEEDPSDRSLEQAHHRLDATRPTAVNLRWALDRVRMRVAALAPGERAPAAWLEAGAIFDEDQTINRAIGTAGLALIESIAAAKRGGTVNVMTHCNAGALATCGWGTATAPLFLAHARGLRMHVWVSETRPRLQGASLTAWELRERGVPHTLFVDAAAGLLMKRGDVDLILVGADRVAANGDVCNKIGTYDKALAARDNSVPFYVALPSPTLDTALADGDAIPIEWRAADEVLEVRGVGAGGTGNAVRIAPATSRAVNPAFDVTPARLVTGFVTERGVAPATRAGLARLFPERYA